MAKKKNEIDKIERIIKGYFNELEEEFGYSEKYYENDISDEEMIKRMKMNFEYFKAGFLFANIDIK